MEVIFPHLRKNKLEFLWTGARPSAVLLLPVTVQFPSRLLFSPLKYPFVRAYNHLKVTMPETKLLFPACCPLTYTNQEYIRSSVCCLLASTSTGHQVLSMWPSFQRTFQILFQCGGSPPFPAVIPAPHWTASCRPPWPCNYCSPERPFNQYTFQKQLSFTYPRAGPQNHQ